MKQASPALLAAAMAGLSSACGDGPDDKAEVTAVSTVASLDANTFDAQCAEQAGVLQFHAHCGGFNLCRGESYDSATQELSEHTCRGLNTCAGMSCVHLSPDRGRAGEALYAELCASCHGATGTFTLPTSEGVMQLHTASVLAKSAAIAFGEDGKGIALAADHAFYESLSRAEVLRLVEYIDSLPLAVGAK